MDNFRNYLQNTNVAERFEYVGSSYEDVRVNLPVEYDVLIILKNGPSLQQDKCSIPGFSFLLVSDTDKTKFDQGYFKKDNKILSSRLVISKFQGFVDNWLTYIKANNQLPTGISDVKRKLHGSAAVQIDAYNDGSAILFSVDLVPTFELDRSSPTEERESYVAKQYFSVGALDKEQAENSWRRSYSLQDKCMLSNIDRGSKIHKNVLRILKAMVNSKDKPRPDLARITSYHIKMAVLKEHDKHPDKWSIDDLVPRFFGVTATLRDAMKQGELYDYFSQKNGMQVNLVSDIPEVTRNQIGNALNDFYSRKNSFINIFEYS